MFQIESQYLGVPTLASNVDGIPETLIHKESGLLVPPGDVGAWTNQLIWVLTHLDEMRSLSENAKSFVKQKFSMAANTKKLIEIISS